MEERARPDTEGVAVAQRRLATRICFDEGGGEANGMRGIGKADRRAHAARGALALHPAQPAALASSRPCA